MRILLLFFGGGEGGDASVFLSMAHEYQRLGLEPTLAARTWDPMLFKRADMLGLKILSAPTWKTIDRSTWQAADIIHLHYCASFIGGRDGLSIGIAKNQRQKFVCTLHGARPAADCMRSAVQRLVSRIASRAVDQFIVPSAHMSDHAREFFPKGTCIATINNPVSEPRQLSKSLAKSELGIEPEARVIGYLGAMSPRKRPLDVLRAAALLPRDNLCWVFAGNGDLIEEGRSFARSNSIRAIFLGQVTDPSNLLRASDVFVFPSERENQPISILEAAMAGIPIVASNLPTLRQEFEGAKSVQLFEVGDVQALADGVDRFLREPMIADCARLAEATTSKYSSSVVASEHLNMYGAMLKSGSKRASDSTTTG